AKEGGIIALTVPSGPWEWQSFHQDGKRFHIHHFELSDLKEIFGTKRNCFIEYLPFSINKKREFLGNWIIVYQKGSGPTGKINSLRKKITTRPFTEAAKALNCSNGSQGSVVI
ncbi:MAG: hypothetical protein SV775_11930, partial [Thermodesulfobacteriota bacterium]|nr:hypothetical protein [Thermodesulfobacteriota bacterium]